MKVVINRCYGGFGLSEEGVEYYCRLKEANGFSYATARAINIYGIDRNDPYLVRTVEELGWETASDGYAKLKVVEIPDDVDWEIENYDGMEVVKEVARKWF